jgi:alanine racemase
MSRPARALISTAALRHNLSRVRQLAPAARVMAVIKANAYGHGTAGAISALGDAASFGVASLEEALAVRALLPSAQPLCLLEGFFNSDELATVAGEGLQVVIHHVSQLEQLEAFRGSGSIAAWVKVDTGMHRLGFPPKALPEILSRMRACERTQLLGLMSHLADADVSDSKPTRRQIDQFNGLLATTGLVGSLANSAGIVAWPESHHDWVRPGIMLYGASPVSGKSAEELDLQPVMQAESALIAINEHRRGDAVGYGGTFVCPEDMRVGVVAFGYGDGYPRHARGGTPVIVRDQRVPLIGRVSMDMITVDLRSLPEASVGDRVILWGSKLPVDEIAQQAGTIAYELLCRVSERVPRVEVAGEPGDGTA